MEVVNTFVIPFLNNEKGLLRCLETLYKYTPPNFRVILIDQSENGVYEKVKQWTHLYIKAYRNLGFAKAANYGLRLADTKFVTIMNDDIELLNKAWWPAIENVFVKFPGAVAVNPGSMRKLNGVGTPVDDVDFPYKEEYTEEEYRKMIEKESKVGDEIREAGIHIDGITPFCVTFKKDEILKCGLFDETFYPGGGEDYDFMNRCYLHANRGDLEGGRWLGTSLSIVWHWWLTTRQTQDIANGFMDASALYKKKWGTPEHDNPYPMGNQSKKLEELEMPEFVIKML